MTIQVIVSEPGKAPVMRTVDDSLEALQAIVGGSVEQLPSSVLPGFDVLANEDGAIKGMPYNRTLNGYRLVGPIVVVKREGTGYVTFSEDEAARVLSLLQASQAS